MPLALFNKIEKWIQASRASEFSSSDALEILKLPDEHLIALFAGADLLRAESFGNRVKLCSIINAKSGRCEQDCSFCAQSAHYHTDIQHFDFVSKQTIIDAAASAKKNHAGRFSIVTSGGALSEDDFESALKSINGLRELSDILPCASLGQVDANGMVALKNAGLTRYHHNLEASKSYYSEVCSTRDFEENVQTCIDAKAAGLSLCCGGIFGMGETLEQRAELAFDVKALQPDSVPINFLTPIPGTPLQYMKELTPLDCLRIVAMMRFVMPKAHILIAGGRESNVGQLQPMLFYAGASGLMVGNYLTTIGRSPEADLEMIEQLGLVVEGCPNEL